MAPMSDRDFAEWYVGKIMASEFPDFVSDLGVAQCERFTRMGLHYARHFRILRPDLQGQFMTIMWALGPNFFETPEFWHVLTDARLDEETKVNALYDVSDEAGGAAFEAADDRYWVPWSIPGNILGLTADPEDTDPAPEDGDG